MDNCLNTPLGKERHLVPPFDKGGLGEIFRLLVWLVLPLLGFVAPIMAEGLSQSAKTTIVRPPGVGEKISLNFQDIEIRAVLQLIADFAGLNLVATDTVVGSITLRLDAIPWDSALDIVLRTKGLSSRKEGNILFVAPEAEFAAREKEALAANQQVQQLAPLQTELIQINYAKAEEMAKFLKQEGNSLLSDKGNVTFDVRTNTLLVKESKKNLDEIRKLVVRLDKAARQVQIEARIVVTNDDFGRDLGVRFGLSTGKNKIKSSGTLDAAERMRLDPVNPPSLNTLKDRLNVNVPVTGAAGTLGFVISKLPLGTLLDLELSALETEGKGEIISSPSLITANQKQAHIESGEEIPYPTTTTSNGVTEVAITFKKAVLSLKVTPQITPDNRVVLGLEVKQDTRGKTVLLPNGTSVPAIDTQLLTTEVLADNNQTIVLGGVYKQTKKTDISRVPFLGKIPLLGALFRKTKNIDDKQELLIFVTPKIITEEQAFFQDK